jgi:hypothetical protein
MTPRWSISSSTSRKLSGKRKYSHTQWEITSTGYRCPLYDGDVLPTDDPSQRDQPEDHPTRSVNVTAPFSDLRQLTLFQRPDHRRR